VTQGRPAPDILVVEDEDLIRFLVVDTLTTEGFTARGARSGEEALTLLIDGLPDLILLDLRMTGMGGREFVEQQREAWGDIPIVLLSGSMEAAAVGAELGAVAVIRKPFDLDDLVAIVRRAVESA
jgi:two-component system, NtrC family, nitrogen regulation response regulator NtrX